MIDSELVPWGKGEKQPGEGGEKYLKPYANNETEHLLSLRVRLETKDKKLKIKNTN